MGNTKSSIKSQEHHVFEKQLQKLNTIITHIIDNNDIFINKEYNFLSKDVCDKYQIILEEDLSKFLKLSINSLGSSMYLIPANYSTSESKITKKQVCERISNHYIKILYILSLVKYVYNLEKQGDMSIAGIIFRNIRILDDVMEINFCEMPHKQYKKTGEVSYRVDFKKLDGFHFFAQYFLNHEESHDFITVLKSILARDSPSKAAKEICQTGNIKAYEQLYKERFGVKKLTCPKEIRKRTAVKVSLDIFVNKDNPVLAKEYCFSPRKVLIKTSTRDGSKVLRLYKEFLKNYERNVQKIQALLDHLVIKDGNTNYILKDIDKHKLDDIIYQVKDTIKVFYLQSFVDYQRILDAAKLTPSIEFAST
jgi:hypothetical protein